MYCFLFLKRQGTLSKVFQYCEKLTVRISLYSFQQNDTVNPMEVEEAKTLANNRSEEGEEDEDTTMADVALEDAKPAKDDASSDSGDSSDSDSEDEALLKLELQNLEMDLSNNPSNYDTHVQVNYFLTFGSRFICVYSCNLIIFVVCCL